MSVPEFDDTGETCLLMMIAHVVVTERTGQNMLVSVLYSIKGFFDSAIKSGLIEASEFRPQLKESAISTTTITAAVRINLPVFFILKYLVPPAVFTYIPYKKINPYILNTYIYVYRKFDSKVKVAKQALSLS